MGSGMGSFFSSNQFGSQMGFNNNMNNVFSSFGNVSNNGFFTNQNNFTHHQHNEENNENEDDGSEEEEESEEELQKRYIALRNSVINQLPRFKYNDYKRMNIGKEIHE